jgi:hypothetical protein
MMVYRAKASLVANASYKRVYAGLVIKPFEEVCAKKMTYYGKTEQFRNNR